MKTLIALGIVVGIVVGGIIAIVATSSTNQQPAQAGEDGLPLGFTYFSDRGHDCYVYRQKAITCVNPVESGQ